MTSALHHRHRITAALVVLWCALSLQLMALPPEAFDFGGGVCVMECSVSGKTCCCARLVRQRHVHHDGHPVWARPGLEPAGHRCPMLATTADESRSHGKTLLPEVRGGSSAVAGWRPDSPADPLTPGTDSLDLAVLPRPPPPLLLFG